MASASSSSLPQTCHRPTHFTTIQECEREEEEEDEEEEVYDETKKTTQTPSEQQNCPTPLHNKSNTKRHEKHNFNEEQQQEDGSVSCNKCRPHTKEKICIVPLDNNYKNGVDKNLSSSFSISSPNRMFKALLSSLTRKSPRSMRATEPSRSSMDRDEQWKIAVTELSHKLIHVTRRRDEAVLEASRLKQSMSELEKKLSKLELYCLNLKSRLENCSSNGNNRGTLVKNHARNVNISDNIIIQQFLLLVSESRTSVRALTRLLIIQLRQFGNRVLDRVSLLLQHYDIKISLSKNPKSALFYIEALLNKAFFEDFESTGFQKGSVNKILNPIKICETNYSTYNTLNDLTWDEVLSKGTRHFDEDFSKFCDRKMSEIVAMLGWNGNWPESLLQAFFNASKNVLLVHLLANSVHPSLPIFRVDKGFEFDPCYMEDMGGDRASKLVPSSVRVMLAPGFYVYGHVVKCKVLCRYRSSISISTSSNSTVNDDNMGLITPP